MPHRAIEWVDRDAQGRPLWSAASQDLARQAKGKLAAHPDPRRIVDLSVGSRAASVTLESFVLPSNKAADCWRVKERAACPSEALLSRA